jgi:hypothetical protein
MNRSGDSVNNEELPVSQSTFEGIKHTSAQMLLTDLDVARSRA